MGIEPAVEATSENVQIEDSSKRIKTFIYWGYFIAPALIATTSVVGFARWTAIGVRLEYSGVWLVLAAVSAGWALTIWYGWLRKKPEPISG